MANHAGLVVLNVYDITNTSSENINTTIVRLNKFTRDMVGVGGVFHGGVEVYGEEWSFGFCENGTGVYPCRPKANSMYTLRESIPLGATGMDHPSVKQLVRQLQAAWQGRSYDLLARNCNHFCDAFSRALGIGPIPSWVNRFAHAADVTVDFTQSAYAVARGVSLEVSDAWTSTVSTIRGLFTPGGSGAQPLDDHGNGGWHPPASSSGAPTSRSSTGVGGAQASGGGQRLGGAGAAPAPAGQLAAISAENRLASAQAAAFRGPPVEPQRL